MAPKQRIRPLALAAVTHQERLLVSEGYDPVKGEKFYRPFGGRIEFGERAADTVTRELREELAIEIVNPRYLGTLESIFTYAGNRGHEIAMVFACNLADPSLYRRDVIEGGLDKDGKRFRGLWKPLADFESGRAILYPDGLLELLRRVTAGKSAQ
jgi:ADP-ribose pyrophosphatase YjhB (NUDIX family)